MRVVYVTHNGIATALVRSQVLPYLQRLTGLGVDPALITYERLGRPLRPDGIPRRWHSLRAARGGALVAKAWDLFRGVFLLMAVMLRHGGLVHARSYLPAAIAWVACAALGRRFIFDMRGFLPEEYVEGGHWTDTDVRYRVLRRFEHWLLRDASAVVVLTHRAADRLRSEERYARPLGDKTVVVIPCAVDLDRFVPRSHGPVPTLVYAGSLGLWYDLDAMLAVFAAAKAALPQLRFLILNAHEQALVRARAAAIGLSSEVEVRAARYDEMPELLGRAHVGICLLRRASSKLGSSPIKVAEYLACGLPVVVNAGQGDNDALIAESSAGHVMSNVTSEEIARAGSAVVALTRDERARAAARRLAEREYSLDEAAARYLRLYRVVDGHAN